jgi:para-nitrobenzyl esterase
MVWIHGGAFQYGSAVYPIYDGSGLARRGVVVVTINYRLGPLGYFAHPALTEDADADEALGNYGFMDQIAALEWVKRNIAAFGGDPQLVTVFGQSAGGSSIAYLLASPQARGLFARAIVQSGGGFQQPASLGQMEERGVAMARAAGLTDHASASDLRALPADSVIAAAEPLQGSAYGPFVDGRTITEAPWQAIRDKRAANVPLLVGWNDNEASVLSALSLSGPTREAEEGLGIDDLRHLYGDVSEDEFRRQVIGDRFFGAPAAWMAATRAIDSPTFLYHFTYVAQRRRERVPGASHGSEIPFVFQTWDKLGSIAQFVSEEDRRFANLISSCWVAFAQSGTPECRGGPTWEAYDPARDRLMLFAPETQMSATPHRAQFDLLTARFFGDAR